MKVDKDENEVVSDHLEQVEEVDSEVNTADAEKTMEILMISKYECECFKSLRSIPFNQTSSYRSQELVSFNVQTEVIKHADQVINLR